MMNRHSKKELTRLILTALILAGGSLYGPVAEAVAKTIESTDTQATLEGKGFAVGNYYDALLIGSQTNGTELTINGVPADYTGYNMAGFYTTTIEQVKKNNKVIVCGGTMKGVYGAYGAAGETTNNTVEINATTNDITITGAIVGAGSGRMTAQDVSGNTVTISGNSSKLHLADAIVYGAIGHGNEFVQNNKVNINTGVTLKGIVGATEYSAGYYSQPNGNVLNLGATGITVTGTGTVEGVQGFETIKIGYTDTNSQFHNVSFADGGTVLSVTGNVLYSNSPHVTGTITLDISGATGITGETSKVGTMTLVSASNSLADMKLKYSSATPAVIPTGGVKVNTDTSTHNNAVNNINLAYTYDHTVKLANSNTSIQYNIANNVSTVSTSGSITWNNGGTARGLTDTTYTFGSGTAIDMSNLTFTGTITGNPLGATSADNQSMTLLSGIKGSDGNNFTIASGKITQPGTGKGTVATAYTTEDIVLNGTASGAVTAEAGALKYTLNSVTLDSVNLEGWNGTTAGAVPTTGWTKNANGISVSGSFEEPTLAEGSSREILTAGSDFFSDATIVEAIRYKSMGETFTGDEANGVTLSGNKAKGVLASTDGTKLLYNYGTRDVTNNIVLGTMDWGTGRTITGTGYTFGNVTGVNATDLAFTFTNTQAGALSSTSNMSLLSGAAGLTAGKTVTYKNSGTNHTQAVSYSADNGATLSGTLTGTVSTAANAVNYAASSMTLDSIDLSSWNGTASSALPTGWTKDGAISVSGTFTKPTMAAGTSLDILTATSDYFSDANIDAAIAYQSSGPLVNDTVNGVNFGGNKAGGVKATNSGQALTYFAENNNVTSITLGAMTWGTPREASTAYDFTGVTSIDASNLTFTNPLSVGTTASLLTNAANLSAGLPITYASGTSHSQNFTNAAAANGAALSGTINGTVASTAGTVDYTVTGKSITGINLSGWDSTKGAYDLTGWTGALAADSINAAGFMAPTTLTAGGSIDILTTGTDDFFADSQITGDLKYGAGASSTDEDNGVIFTGTQSKGVKASADGQKLVYAAGDMAVTGISFGTMTPGTARTVTTGYDFSGVTSIDAAGLKFTKPEEAVNGTLVSAGGLTYTTVSNPNHSQAITSAALGNGITGSGTLTGTVSASAGTISYTVGGKSLASMNLSGWNGTTTSLPAGWTGSNVAVTTGSFVVPNGDTVIFNGGTAGFFGTVTGDRAYKDGVKVTEAAKNGVALTGTKNGGVKAIDNGATLKYFTETMNANAITLGKMTWGTGRDITESGYTFDGVGNNGVDATSLTFAFAGNTVNTIASGDDWDLVTGASGLAAGLTVKGSPVSQQVSYGISNVASLTGTLTGKVTTNTNAVHYAVTGKTLNSIDISAWNGTTTDTAVDASWSKNPQGISVTGSGFTTPTVTGEYNILTAGSTGFFTGAQIDSSIAYQPSGAYSETEKNITLSGKQARGVLVSSNGMALQYKIGTAYIDTIKLGQVAYSKDAVLLDKSGAMYNYANVTALDKSGFRVTMTDDQRKTAQTADSMTIVKANGTLNNLGVQDTQNSKYTYTANPGLTVKGTIVTNLTATGGSVLYTVDSNKASDLTVGSVTWNSTYARPGSEIAYSDAIVNAENVTFSGVSTLKKGDTMTLVSNFGTSINKVRGGIFTLSNGKTGKGHAYYDSTTHSLVYVVDRGVDDEVETKTAIGTKTIIINEQPHQGDVPGGEAEGDGEAKDNETIIKKSHIKKNPDGTGGDTNGGTSEDGDADENKLDIEESEIDGDATGGQSDTGNTDDNETIIKKKSIIHGGVAGGETLGGHGGSRRNKTTVEDSTVEGDVDGGKTGGDGETEENEVVITGSKIGGDVNGGHSGGDGDSSGNEVTVDNSTVDGDVNGGKSDGNGNTKNNKVDIKKGSKIGGSVHGGHSGGSGDSTGNEVTVDGSEVDGNVMGGRTKDGNANNNTVNIDGGSTINGSVYGGYSDTGDASGNNVNIGTGKINGDIYGGYSGGTGSTINNTVTLYGDADVSGSNIIGGSNGSTGNTLNIGKGTESWTGGGQTVKNVSNFDTLNFTALPWNSDNPALTIGDGSATDLSNTTVTAQQVAFTGVKTISVGSTMMFLDQSNVAAGKKATNINYGSDFTVGTAMEGTGKLVLDANGNVVYQVETAGVSRQTHNTVMAAEAAVVALNAGNDFILSAREGLARKENIGKDGVAVFAKIGGGAMRQETGSHVNVNMWNGIVALGRKNVQKESTTEYGVFVEHGWGNFSTHSDNAQRGDGSVDYTGGGLLGKWTKADGLYVEGSLRIGSMHEKANNLLRDTVRGYGYDERTTYKGFHLGVGKEFAIKDGNTVEVYGKYFYNRKDGMNFNAGLDEYNLDAVTSQIIRIGARYTMKRERWNYYGDLSYEHELDGKAAGRANGMAIRGADTSGGSVRLELGAKLLANEKSPWTLDLNLTGYAGKKQGLQGGVSVKFMF